MSRRLIKTDEARRIRGGCSLSKLYSDVRAGILPQPVRLGPRFSGWVEDEFMEAHERQIEAARRGAPPPINLPKRPRGRPRKSAEAEATSTPPAE